MHGQCDSLDSIASIKIWSAETSPPKQTDFPSPRRCRWNRSVCASNNAEQSDARFAAWAAGRLWKWSSRVGAKFQVPRSTNRSGANRFEIPVTLKLSFTDSSPGDSACDSFEPARFSRKLSINSLIEKVETKYEANTNPSVITPTDHQCVKACAFRVIGMRGVPTALQIMVIGQSKQE